MGRKLILKNHRGQLLVEAVLLSLIFIGLSYTVVTQLKKIEFLQKITVQPWARLQGMIECGVWDPCGIEVKKGGLHPSTTSRVLTLDPSFEVVDGN